MTRETNWSDWRERTFYNEVLLGWVGRLRLMGRALLHSPAGANSQTCNHINSRTVSVRFNLNTTGCAHSALARPSEHLPVITPKHSSAGPRAVSWTYKISFGIYWRGYSFSHSAKRSRIKKHWILGRSVLSFQSPLSFHSSTGKKQPSEQYVLGYINPVPLHSFLPWVCVSFRVESFQFQVA